MRMIFIFVFSYARVRGVAEAVVPPGTPPPPPTARTRQPPAARSQ